MTLRVAQFSLKIAHLSFSMGPRGPRAYGLGPRLWLLICGNLLRANSKVHREPFMVLVSYAFVLSLLGQS